MLATLMNPDPPDLPSPPKPLVPDLFQGTPYRLIRPLGEGGMGAVFLVEHVDLGRRFVAKVLHLRLAGNATLIDRMRVEAQSMGRLQHPNTVRINGFGTTHDGRPFLVMEWLQGHLLSDELEYRGQLPASEALELASQMLSALGAAHAIGVVHRDIKPENLFLCEGVTGRGRLKVLDFGVARVMPDAPEGAPDPLVVPTGTGVVVGTPRYVSPEGAMGRRVDARADVYAAALVLYNMLAGRGPFDAFDGERLLAAHAFDDPEPPSRYARELVPESLDAAVLKALSKNAEDRFQTALAFKGELDRILDASYGQFQQQLTFEARSFFGADLRAKSATESFDPRLLPLADGGAPTHPQGSPAPVVAPMATATAAAPARAPAPSTAAKAESSPHPQSRRAPSSPPVAPPPSTTRIIAISALTALVVALFVALAVTALLGGLR